MSAERVDMTSAVSNNNPTGDQFPASSTSSSSNSSAGSSTASSANPYNLKPADFIKLMVTQLQHQDPTQPASNQDLLAQVSQIGQLEASTELQTTLTGVTMQTQVGSASALIGKNVSGVNASNDKVSGVVKSVSVASGNVSLNLSDGSTMALSGLSSINAAA